MKMMHRLMVVFIAMALLIVAGCSSSQVTGNGKVVTKERSVNDFDQIKVSGSYQIEIVQGDHDTLKVTTDSNVEPLVITKVDNGILNISNKPDVHFNVKKLVLVQISIKNLKEIVVSGASQVSASNVSTDTLTLNTNGAIQADLSGSVKQLNLKISGSGNIAADKLKAENVKIRLTGSGQVTVNASKKLDTKITGSGSIMYAGNPADVDQSIVGSGKLERIKN